MKELRGEMLSLKQQIAENPDDQAAISLRQQLKEEYEAQSALLGGDEPPENESAATTQSSIAAQSLFAPASVAPTPPSCTGSTATFSNSTAASITSFSTTTSTINVSGAGPYLWDLDLQTFITHTANADLDITLTSPAGSVVTITTDNGSTNDNVFNGTMWDDQAATPVTDFAFANNVVAASLQVEEALGRFIGENPNGTWKLTIFDDTFFNTGSLNSWSLTINTFSAAPTEATSSFSNTTPVSITSNNTVISMISASGAGTSVRKVAMKTNITHTDNDDLDITLTSPSGRVVTITTDNADDDDDVFNGTVWHDAAGAANAPGPVTDTNFSDDVVEVTLVPEGAMAAFNGENPNGTWTLTITDDASGDTGSLNSWSLIITTATCAEADPCIGTTQTFSNNTAAAIAAATPVTQTITVSGAGPYLFDSNLKTFITHTNNADIDMTLTSPAGTVVTITTDNGGSDNNVFNGTVWDDQADPDGQVPYSSNNGLVTDHNYSNNVLASPLVPEEALGAFIGENPNGVWTLSIVDDDAGGGTGTLSSWSLELTSLPGPPISATSNFSNMNAAFITSITPTVKSAITVTGVGTRLGTLRLTTDVSHTNNADIDMTLTSPSGRVVTLTTDNGGSNNDVFEGTLWDDKAGATNPPGPVTDTTFANNVVETPLVPEEALAAFNGENPNGVWVLTVDDDSFNLDIGTLNSWSLEITTITCCTPPAVTMNPSNQSVCAGNTATFMAAASGNPAPTVQWQVSTNGGMSFSDIPGATGTTLSFTAAAADNGKQYRAVFTSSCGTATSTAATLTVNTAPVVTMNPTSQTSMGGSIVTFTAAATGSPAPTVQWQVSTNGGASFSNIPGATSTTLSFMPTPAQHGNLYRAVFTNVCGTATTTTSGGAGALTVFDICIEQGTLTTQAFLIFNSVTGDYRFQHCSKGITLTGKGKVTISFCKIELKDSGPDPKKPDRTVSAVVNPCTRVGDATVQQLPGGTVNKINDTNITNNTCRCPTQ